MAREELGNLGEQVNPSDIQNYVQDLDFPVGKQTIIDAARERGAGDSVMNMLDRLPDKEYQSPSDVSQELGGIF